MFHRTVPHPSYCNNSSKGIFVPLETRRQENLGADPVRIIEVQTGAYLEEDNIRRLDNDFLARDSGKGLKEILDFQGANSLIKLFSND